jgi:hypothetical protein
LDGGGLNSIATAAIGALSAGQFPNLTRTKFFDRKEKRRNKGKKIGETARPCPKNNNSERPIVKPLLFRQPLVNRNQDIEAPDHGIEQAPSSRFPQPMSEAVRTSCTDNFVARRFGTQPSRRTRTPKRR